MHRTRPLPASRRVLAAPLALTLLLAGCGGGGGGGRPGGTSLAGSPRTEVPDEVVGTWNYGTVTGVDFYDPSTGRWAPSSGIGQSYTFKKDGEFVWGGVFQLSNYGCTTTLHKWQHGTVVFDGTTFTRHAVEGAFKAQDSCNAANNREETRIDPPSSFQWEVGEDSGTTVFREYDLQDQFWLTYRAQ